jgi:hypothetical protein
VLSTTVLAKSLTMVADDNEKSRVQQTTSLKFIMNILEESIDVSHSIQIVAPVNVFHVVFDVGKGLWRHIVVVG